MKKIYSFTSILALIALVLIGHGCIKDRGVDCLVQEAQTLTLRVNIHGITESRALALRATENGEDIYNENRIDAFSVLFYKPDGSLFWSVPSTGLEANAAGTYIIPVPQQHIAALDGNTAYRIYVVANHSFTTAPATEEALKSTVISEAIPQTPAKFVMAGMVTKSVDMSSEAGKTLGTVDLKRVAAKVRLRQPSVTVDGYEVVGTIEAKLRGTRDKGQLINPTVEPTSTLVASDYRPVTEMVQGVKSTHFYSYYTKWIGEVDRPTIFVKVMMKKNGTADSTAKAYYYRVPVEASGAELKSNYLYDVSVTIEILGGLTPEDPKRIVGTVSVKNWIAHDDVFELPATKYLMVAEHQASMNSITDRDISYQSSSTASIAKKNAYYRYVDNDKTSPTYGKEVVKDCTGNDIPTIAINAVDSKVHIYSRIPVNNIPKTIEFDVTNLDGFSEHIVVTQYPDNYITYTWGTKSFLRPDGTLPSHLNNKAMYHVVVQVPPTDMILGFPPTQSQAFYKRKSFVFTDQITKDDLETSKMVSPSFELASQLGATYPMPYYEYKYNGYSYRYPQALYQSTGGGFLSYDYSSTYPNPYGAAFDCAKYTETRVVNGVDVTLNDWRLPTEAEIKLIDQLQRDRNSAVKSIMTGHYYWDAYSRDGATELIGGSEGSSTNAYVRCVRDVKDNTVD